MEVRRERSTVRGLWTDRPENLVDRSAALDVGVLALAAPFGLLAADDPRLRASAEAILRHNQVEGEPALLTSWSPDPTAPAGGTSPTAVHRPQASSLATLWMVRYLLQLGRATGDGSAWARALGLLDALLGRLCTLGVGLRSAPRWQDDPMTPGRELPGAWELHAMLVESLLDLSGLDYDARARTLILDPALPPTWPHIGLSQPFLCGTASYRLERPLGSTSHRLTLDARLDHPVTLEVGVTCPGLIEKTRWSARPSQDCPAFDRRRGRLSWTCQLPAGETSRDWAWG